MTTENIENTNIREEKQEEKSFFSVIVHSFFIIPFLIAVFCVLLFAGIHLLTHEKKTVFDYLEDVKTGGLTKRWQGAFELSKFLANPTLVSKDKRFSSELIKAFVQAQHDDNRVRQYLALAMGRTANREFVTPLIDGLRNEKQENLPAVIYALGMLKDKRAVRILYPYLDSHEAMVRSITVVSLGNIADPESKSFIKKGLMDSEPNVQWGAAISLAQMGDSSGKKILLKLLNRQYLSQFPEVDMDEQNNLIMTTIDAASHLNDSELINTIRELSQSDQNMKIRSAALKIANQK